MINRDNCTRLVVFACCIGLTIYALSPTTDKSHKHTDEDYIYSKERYGCNEYTHLKDFKVRQIIASSSGYRHLVTLTFDNGDKFLYTCGRRAIDICNNLSVGVEACYYTDEHHNVPNEVVYGWPDGFIKKE